MAEKRKAIGKKLRFEVFKRDGFKCQYCGAVPPGVLLQADHIVPVAGGGDNSIDNLITSCQPCNIGKGANSLQAIPKSLREKAAEVQEREDQIKEYNAIISGSRDRLERDCWVVANAFLDGMGHEKNSIRTDYFNSIKIFVGRAGLYPCLDGVDAAHARFQRGSMDKIFRYFCGVMWRKIKGAEL